MPYCITIYTDASHCQQTQKAGWACWIKFAPDGVIERSGAMKMTAPDSTAAEMMAIANALAIVKRRLAPADAVLLVNTDSMNAINRITGRTSKQAKKKCKHLQALADVINDLVPEGCELRMKHVKAHNGTKDGKRSYINNRVDKAARKALRLARCAPVFPAAPVPADASHQVHAVAE